MARLQNSIETPADCRKKAILSSLETAIGSHGRPAVWKRLELQLSGSDVASDRSVRVLRMLETPPLDTEPVLPRRWDTRKGFSPLHYRPPPDGAKTHQMGWHLHRPEQSDGRMRDQETQAIRLWLIDEAESSASGACAYRTRPKASLRTGFYPVVGRQKYTTS